MHVTVDQLKSWATEAGHAAESEVQKFIALVEGKARIEAAKAILEGAGYRVTPPPSAA